MEVSSVPSVPLKYRIAKCTGHCGAYVAENILVDNPLDEKSRWGDSIKSENIRRWILLELVELSLVHSITFGKFHKKHLCDMKEFKVYVGRTMDSLSLALHEYLLNEPTPETFEFRRINRSGLLVPIRYIKIVPISAHSADFNTSIWHVALSGVSEPQIVKHAQEAYARYTETQTLKHVLKFLRQQRHLTAYDALLRRADQPLEHPMITRIYDELMLGNWGTVESLIASVATEGLFDQKIFQSEPKAIWHRINGLTPNEMLPSARGGHQMCIDVDARTIYLFGGWNGDHDLDDLWSYSIDEQRWGLLARHTAEDGGPSPRSCHKISFDPLTGYLYILGRIADMDVPAGADVPNLSQPSQTSASGREVSTSADSRNPFASDFYRYSTRGPNSGKWTLLSENTAKEDGPCLIYDHQIAIDPEKQTLYVSGGRIVDFGPARFSGFYEYHIITGKWEQIRDEMRSHRYGHSMVFDTIRRRLIFLAGKNNETFLTDMYMYDVDCRTFINVTNDFTAQGGPDPSFCQRAVVDQESGLLFTLPGILKPKSQKSSNIDTLQSAFWIYKPNSSAWMKVLGFRPSSSETDRQINDETSEPPPRFAHEMIYDPVRNTIYVHGGNSGHKENRRLDDFWSMNLIHPTREDFVRKATYIIRRQQFKELCEVQSPVQALTFLQQEVYSMVDHSSNEETESFRALHSHLFDGAHSPYMNRRSVGVEEGDTSVFENEIEQPGEQSEDTVSSRKSFSLEEDGYRELDEAHFRQRTEVFESFLGLVNSNAKQPETDIINIMEEIDMLC